MKLNWKTIKIVFALVIIIGAIFWAADRVRPRSYSGTNLTFSVGSGPVTLTNPSNRIIPVQLVSSGVRSFRVTSTIDDVSGNSTREGTGTSATQLFEFGLPMGSSEITIARGSGVNFVANTATRLEATVQPVSEGSSKTTIIVAAVIVLGALYYISSATDHRWIGILRGKQISTPDLKPVAESAAGGQGRAPRSYNDNRA